MKLGLEDMANRASRVESSIAEAQEMIKAYDDITDLQEKALIDRYAWTRLR